MTDEEIARKMHEEMNGTVRGRRGAAASSSKSKSPRKKSKVKSKSTVDSDGEGGDGEPPKKKRGGGGFSKPMAMSPELIAVVGTEEPVSLSHRSWHVPGQSLLKNVLPRRFPFMSFRWREVPWSRLYGFTSKQTTSKIRLRRCTSCATTTSGGSSRPTEFIHLP